MDWKKGRGKLGPLEPLLGRWVFEGDSERGPVRCTRAFGKTLEGKYVQLDVEWAFDSSNYLEHCLFGTGGESSLRFWSFTSDGKRSEGELADGTDVDPRAVAFVAQMKAGVARQVYWPDPDGAGLRWAVESKTKKGWSRFVEHLYVPG